MAVLHLWNILFNLLTSTVGTDNPIVSNDIDIVYTIAGDQCIIGTWPLNGSNLAINVTKGNGARLNAFIGGSIGKHTTVQFGRLILKYNHSIMEASLMFDKVSSEDEGLYEILETFYMPKSAPYDTVPEAYERKDGRWSLELNILERGEVQLGEVGKNITMEFEILPEISTLYIFDTVGSVLHEQGCSISTQSHLYGRLRCVSDKFHKTYRITIDNVTQRDAGLYKVSTERDKRWRRFLNITEKPACAVVGENITFGWFYNQQGIKRTLLVIHPNQEVIMQLAPTNVPEIKRKFQHRFSYKGNVSGSFMLLTLLNVSKSDAGLYSIETLHGNIIPGWKQLNVDDTIDVPIYVVISVAVGILALNGCVIWIHHKRNYTLKTGTDRLHSHEGDNDLYLTPVGVERHLPIPLMNEGHAADSQTAQLDSRTLLLHTNYNLCMDGYEMVDVSSNDASESVFNNDETVHEQTETISKRVQDNFGYLTVLGVLETSV